MGKSRKFHFTAKKLESLPRASAKTVTVEYSDTDITGLKLSVTQEGKKRFFFRYNFRRRKCCMKLGEFPAMSLEEARKTAAKNRNVVTAGEDPQLAKRKILDALTFKEFAEQEYLPFAQNHKRSWKQDQQRLARLYSVFGRLTLDAITTHEVQKFLDAEQSRTSGTTANRTLSLLHRMYALASNGR